MFPFATWLVVVVVGWVAVVAVVLMLLLRPCARREQFERDSWDEFERATGRREDES